MRKSKKFNLYILEAHNLLRSISSTGINSPNSYPPYGEWMECWMATPGGLATWSPNVMYAPSKYVSPYDGNKLRKDNNVHKEQNSILL